MNTYERVLNQIIYLRAEADSLDEEPSEDGFEPLKETLTRPVVTGVRAVYQVSDFLRVSFHVKPA